MILVFDTNSFLQQSVAQMGLACWFPSANEDQDFLVAIDKGGFVMKEYLEASDKQTDPEHPMRIAAERIGKGTGLFVVKCHAHLRDEIRQVLVKTGCDSQIEKIFIALADCEQGIVIHPNQIDSLPIPRKYLRSDALAVIQREVDGPDTMTLDSLYTYLHKQPHRQSPSSIEELRRLLDTERSSSNLSEEQRYLEFKCPKEDYLTRSMLRASVVAVCGFLNTCAGWVFIGVRDDDGSVEPFSPRYGSKGARKSVDLLQREILDEIRLISPRPALLYSIWPIWNEDRDKCVIAIYVRKGSQEYYYRDKKGMGKKFTCKYVREGPSTVCYK